jgi:S1-C subfamily serine protease
MLALALLIPTPADPVIPGSKLSEEAQWAAIEACPQVSVPNQVAGTGVVIGTRNGFGYVLTAAHVVPYDGVEVAFTTREANLKTHREANVKPVWYGRSPKVVNRWHDADLALVEFRIPDDLPVPEVPRLPLAGPGQRPKSFPFPAWSVGIGPSGGAAVRADRVVAKQAVRPPGRGLAFYWETAVAPEVGRSGGPLLDNDGQIIGLCAAARGEHGYYTHLDEILAALKRDGYGWLVPARP